MFIKWCSLLVYIKMHIFAMCFTLVIAGIVRFLFNESNKQQQTNYVRYIKKIMFPIKVLQHLHFILFKSRVQRVQRCVFEHYIFLV